MEHWRGVLNENKLRVFDFDDTLVQTDAMIILYRADGETIEQSPGEWAVYNPQKGDEFD
jgi:phosphoserine phosphatase